MLRRLASAPRASGTPAIAEARDFCAGELRRFGFHVSEMPFSYSALPGRFATPAAGAAVAGMVAVAAHLGAGGERYAPLLVLGSGALLLGIGARWIARQGVLDMPWLRMQGVNLEGVRPGPRPRVWLCAHLDSKSQPVPTLARSAALVLEGLGLAAALAAAVAASLGAAPAYGVWVAVTVLTLAGAVPVLLSTVGNSSAGAFDNASGVATVLEAASQLDAGVGVLITDAEELGLAGARAWARTQASGETVLNCDGVDDAGAVAVMYTGRRPHVLLVAVSAAAARSGVPFRALRMIPGVLTDSVAFTDAGMAAVTFSRGSAASLLRVHSPRDTLDRLRGTGIAPTAALIAATARELHTPR